MKFVERVNEEFTKTSRINTLQVNVGTVCNLVCTHCHVSAGPDRKEKMTAETVDKIERLLQKFDFDTLDITGGEPTMNENIERLVELGAKYTKKVIVRTNLVNLLNKPHLFELFKKNNVNVVASLPCYSKENVDDMRGRGVYEASIRAIKMLNEIGYGKEDGLELDFVYNPGGAFLPPSQDALELDYKKMLYDDHKIEFNNLYTITNITMGRFKDALVNEGLLDEYMNVLEESFNENTLAGLMCRSQISLDYLGRTFDCDFNQMLDMGTKGYRTIDELLKLDSMDREIVFEDHCYACTAGAGSSCGGALE